MRVREVGLRGLLKQAALAMSDDPGAGEWEPVIDLNRFGVAFRTAQNLEVEQRIVVTLWIADNIPRIELMGRIVWMRAEKEEERSVGVRFIDYRRLAWSVLQGFDKDYGASEASPRTDEKNSA